MALEVSSFQLDFIKDFKPKVAAILNITPDHLNRYENKFENYIASKNRIYLNQDSGDYLILNADDEVISNSIKNVKSNIVRFSLKTQQENGVYVDSENIILKLAGNEKFRCSVNDLSLLGEHNIANTMAVIAAAKLFDLDSKLIKEGNRDHLKELSIV